MSGFGFQSKGTAGVAPQTVWFGALPDRLNMVVPYNYPTEFVKKTLTAVVPAHYGNLWTPFNSSFTTFTTAPDGTSSSAQLLTEDTSNSIHKCQAGTYFDGINSASPGATLGVLRAVMIVKASGRRVGFLISNPNFSATATLTVVFDLVGGQVGVPATVSNIDNTAIITPTNTQIFPLPASFGGGGWYYCIQDFFWRDGFAGFLVAEIFLDQGTGTGALNNSYVGNGTSGVYLWRTNVMPVVSYGINTTPFLADFLSLSEIDTTNSLQPGFKFYTQYTYQNFLGNDGFSPFTPSQIAVAGSILTLSGPAGPDDFALVSAAQTNPATQAYVGTGFDNYKPTLFELKMSWTYTTPWPVGNTAGLGGYDLTWILSQGQFANTVPADPRALRSGREMDLVELWGSGGNANPDSAALVYEGTGSPSGFVPPGIAFSLTTNGTLAAYGFPPWFSTATYAGGTFNVVMSGGLAYISHAANINQMPPNATYWTNSTYPNNEPVAPVDFTQMHTWSWLVVPYLGGAPGYSNKTAQQSTTSFAAHDQNVSGSVPDQQVGFNLLFFDGAYIGLEGCWGANLNPSYMGRQGTGMFASDGHKTLISLSPGHAYTGALNVDYFMVMQ